MKLCHGRPSDTAGREAREIRTYDFLDSLGIEYWQTDHENANTMEDCLLIDEALGAPMCKNLFLTNRQKTEFYLLMMPADKPFKTKEIPPQIGCARLSFAPEEYMEKYLDILPGAVSVLGLMNDRDHAVRLLVDEDILGQEFLGCHPCVNTSSLKIRTSDVFGPFLKAAGCDYTTVVLKGE